MEELLAWRNRHHSFKIELLKLSNKIVQSTELEDKVFYQEICEKYAYHLRKIEKECYSTLGVNICSCNFNPEQCNQ